MAQTFAAPRDPRGDRRERTVSNPQSHPGDVTRRALFKSVWSLSETCHAQVWTRGINFWTDKRCQRAMRKTTELWLLREPRRKGCHRPGGTEPSSEAGQLSAAVPAHMQNKEPHMDSTAALVLTVLRNWISSSPSPPSAMAAQEPVQQPPLAPLHSRY